LLEWSAVGLKSNNISKIVSASEDMVIICGYEENAYTIWKLTITDMFDERTVITLMTGNESAWWLTDCVYEFNKLNEEYRVVLDNPTAGLEKEDVSTRQQLLLTSSTPPDLVDLSFVENWKEYAANGVFEDLSAYFQNSNILDENEYLPNIMEGGKIGEEQIFIPYSFGFTMLYGQEQYLGKEGGWTLQDLLELYHEHEEISILNYESTLALESLLSLSMEEFVDYSQVSCDFEVPLFYDLLQCTAKARYTEGDYTMFCSNVLENRALMDEAIIFNMESYLAYTGLMEENTSDSGTKLVLKGYPSKDGKMRGEAYLSPSTYFGICSNSDNKEGAWQFLEYLLSCEDYFVDAFPSRRDWLIKRMNSCNPDYFAGVEELREITKEDEEQLLSIIEGLNFTSNQDKNIIQVVTEEAQEYYEGDKSEEEVAQIIQNRIQLYLWENSD
jgi:ABC-type glycerol-3-phosphate transport system substrate-binding protein